MSAYDDLPPYGNAREDRILDEYLAAKDARDAAKMVEYGAGLSGAPQHKGVGSSRGASAGRGPEKEAGSGSFSDYDIRDYARGIAVMDELEEEKEAESAMAASEEGLDAFMRSIGFEPDEEDAISEADEEISVSDQEKLDAVDDSYDDVDSSYGTAIGIKSPLEGRFDLRTGRVGNALGEGTDYPLLDLDGDYSALPSPEVLAAYPPEVQRKIIEWTDRDVRARRDNESLRQDILLRESIAQRKTILIVAVLVVVACIACAVACSLLLKSAVYAVVFLVIPLIVVVAALVWLLGFGKPKG